MFGYFTNDVLYSALKSVERVGVFFTLLASVFRTSRKENNVIRKYKATHNSYS